MKILRAPLLYASIGLILLAATATSLRNIQSKWKLPEEVGYLPQANVVKLLCLGHQESAASILWIRSLIYFSDRTFRGLETQWMLYMLDLITQLDPYNNAAYKFVSCALKTPLKNDPRDIEVLARGVHYFPGDWQLALFYSLRLIEKDSNYAQASEVMKSFADVDSVPPHIRRIHVYFKTHVEPFPISLQLLLNEWYKATPQFRTYIGKKIAALYTKNNRLTAQHYLDNQINNPAAPEQVITYLLHLNN